jgi:hypothetical protein
MFAHDDMETFNLEQQVGEKCQIYGYFDTNKVKITLETSGEDVKIHSKQVENIFRYTRNEWGRLKQ